MIARITIHGNVVSSFRHLASPNGGIHDVEIATYLARQFLERGSAPYCGDKSWLELHDGHFMHDHSSFLGQDIATVRTALVRQAEVFAQFSVLTQLPQHEVGHI